MSNLFIKIFGFIPKALAQVGPITGGTTLPNPIGSNSIMAVINNILNYFIYISAPIFALMVLIGGFQILMARDDPSKVTNGRNTILYASIGFAIILISKGIALIILDILK